MSKHPPALLTINDVARRIVSSDRHVRRPIKHELPAHRIGKLVRISPDDLERYLVLGTAAPSPARH